MAISYVVGSVDRAGHIHCEVPLSAFGSDEAVLTALNYGAFDFIDKVDCDKIELAVKKALVIGKSNIERKGEKDNSLSKQAEEEFFAQIKKNSF